MSRRRRESISSLGSPAARRASTVHEPMRSDRPPDRSGLGGWLRGALVDNPGLKLLSLILALTVYLLVNTDEDRVIKAWVPVAYLLPPDKALVSEEIAEVEVRIRGPWRRIKRFDDREIDRIDIDLTNVQSGEVAISPDRIHLPRGLELISINPRVIKVAFEDMETRTIEIDPTVAGRPMHGYHALRDQIRVEPHDIQVRGAAGVVRALQSVRTQEIRLDGAAQKVEKVVQLVPPAGITILGNEPISVSVPIEPEVVVKKLAAVTVHLRMDPAATGPWGDPAKWTIDVSDVALELNGYLLDVERWIDGGVVAVATVPVEATAKGTRAEVTVVLEDVPQGVGVKVSPAKVSVAPKK